MKRKSGVIPKVDTILHSMYDSFQKDESESVEIREKFKDFELFVSDVAIQADGIRDYCTPKEAAVLNDYLDNYFKNCTDVA